MAHEQFTPQNQADQTRANLVAQQMNSQQVANQLDDNQGLKNTWLKVDDMIYQWLNERQQLILKLCSIFTLKEFTPKDLPVENKIQAFCQVLVDYVSAGHFEIYEQLLDEARSFHDDYLSLTEPLYELISQTTEKALDFNEKYETRELCSSLAEDLPLDLSRLGEALEARFEAEDELIKCLHDSHKDKVA